MASIYARGRKLWCRLKDGEWICAPTPFAVGDEVKARRFAVAAQRAIDQRLAGGTDGPATVRRYAEAWLESRHQKHEATRRRYEATGQGRVQHRDHATDAGRMRKHVLPYLGDLLLSDVRPRHLAGWIHELRTKTSLSAKTVRNVYGLACALFRDAAIAGNIEATPCVLVDAQLGEEDETGEGAGRYSREQLELMIGSTQLSDYQRIFAALGGLAGRRLGEVCGFRWGDLDTSAVPLWRLTSSRAYDRRPTKTSRTSQIPVHPALADMLTAWRHGWAAMFGRAPTADDPIVPRAPGKWIDKPGGPHSKKTGGNLMDSILAALAIPPAPKKTHALKSTFISLAMEDGASRELIKRITHTPGNGRDAFARYDRAEYWPQLCAEVARLRITPRSGGQLVKLATPLATVIKSSSENAEEAPGLEAGAAIIPIRDGARNRQVAADDAHPSDLERTIHVANLATALAEAVLAGDMGRARDLAREVLAEQGRAAQ
jgi:integrase